MDIVNWYENIYITSVTHIKHFDSMDSIISNIMFKSIVLNMRTVRLSMILI